MFTKPHDKKFLSPIPSFTGIGVIGAVLVIALLPGTGTGWAGIVTNDLVIHLNAKDDINPPDGWNHTVPAGGRASYIGMGAHMSQQTQGDATYMHNPAEKRMFYTEVGVTTNAPAAVDLTSFTVEIMARRIKTNSVSNEQHLFNLRNTNNTAFIQLVIPSATSASASFFYRGFTNDFIAHNAIADLITNEWRHLFFTYQDSSSALANDGVLTIYEFSVSGHAKTVFEDQDPFFGSDTGETGYHAVFGANHLEIGRQLIGDISFFRVYTAALSAQAVHLNFFETAPAFGMAPAVAFDQVETTNTTAIEFSTVGEVEYGLEYADPGDTNTFFDTGARLVGNNDPMQFFDPEGFSTSRIYRVFLP